MTLSPRDPRPSHQVVTSAKDAVASGVTGVAGLARQGRRWSVELKRSVSHAVDVVLGKSEELVAHFLPMTEDELGEASVLPSPPRILPPRPHARRVQTREGGDPPKATQQTCGTHRAPVCFRGPPARILRDA